LNISFPLFLESRNSKNKIRAFVEKGNI